MKKMNINSYKYILFYNLIFLLILNINSFANEALAKNELYFNKANTYYKSGEYSKAIEKYQQIYESGYISSELFYNLGNSYYRIGDYPKSILFYEKAKKLKPNDKDIIENLKIANNKIIDKIPEIEEFFIYQWAYRIRDVFSVNSWTMIFIVFIIIASFSYILKLFLQSNSKLNKVFSIVGVLSILFCIITISIASLRLKSENSQSNAIIMASTIDIKQSLDPASEIAFTIHAGTKVRILEFQENNYKIKIGDGKVGWIPKNELELI